MNWIINFWLDYASSGYNKLKKNDSDPEIDIILNTSFIQSLNLDLILVLIFKLISFKITDFKYMIITTIIMIVINYFWYNNLSKSKKEEIKNRIPQFGSFVYRLYALFSAVSLFIIAYLLR